MAFSELTGVASSTPSPAAQSNGREALANGALVICWWWKTIKRVALAMAA